MKKILKSDLFYRQFALIIEKIDALGEKIRPDFPNWMSVKEKKTPVVCVSEKNRPGFWILIHSDDLLKL